MNITDPGIEKYINSLLPPRDEVLLEMERRAAAEHIPIIGPAVAGFLAQLARMSGARRIFELGSAIGYSTIWLARAAGDGAEVHYSDASETNASDARRYFERAGVAERIRIHTGDALAALEATSGEFDFIFNDVDKEGYMAVLKAVTPRLQRGGLFISDNTLWHGRVLHPTEESDRTIVEFNSKLFRSGDFLATLVPFRDGLTIGIRL